MFGIKRLVDATARGEQGVDKCANTEGKLVSDQGLIQDVISDNFRAFIPVTDGTYVPGPPSTQLAQGKLNGLGLLVGVGLSWSKEVQGLTGNPEQRKRGLFDSTSQHCDAK